jgi:hypothetical protein
MTQQIKFELLNEDSERPPSLKGLIEIGVGTIMFNFDGYGDGGSPPEEGFPIAIRWDDNQLKLYVWADINREEATHIINLEGALEKARKA